MRQRASSGSFGSYWCVPCSEERKHWRCWTNTYQGSLWFLPLITRSCMGLVNSLISQWKRDTNTSLICFDCKLFGAKAVSYYVSITLSAVGSWPWLRPFSSHIISIISGTDVGTDKASDQKYFVEFRQIAGWLMDYGQIPTRDGRRPTNSIHMCPNFECRWWQVNALNNCGNDRLPSVIDLRKIVWKEFPSSHTIP